MRRVNAGDLLVVISPWAEFAPVATPGLKENHQMKGEVVLYVAPTETWFGERWSRIICSKGLGWIRRDYLEHPDDRG